MPTEPLKQNSVQNYADEIVREFGGLAPQILQFVNLCPDPSQMATLVLRDFPDAVRILASEAPLILDQLGGDLSLTQSILSRDANLGRVEDLALDALPANVARTYIQQRIAVLADWALDPETNASRKLTELAEALLTHIHRRLQLSFSLIALGSLASGDLAPHSNLNLLIVAESPDPQRNDLETHALLGFFQGLRHYGLEIDLQIQRIHGRLYMDQGGLSGLAVSTLQPDEFVALSLTRPLIGHPARTVEPTPMTPERLRNLAKHKHRMETELVQPRYRRRNVKFGEGGLNDIEWLLLLNEARYPTATDRVRPGPLGSSEAHLWRTVDRINKLAEAQLLTPMESDELTAAHRHGMEVRLRLCLLDLHADVIPENPDKLLRLAMTMGFADGNEFLRMHEEHIDAVRSIFQDSLRRLNP